VAISDEEQKRRYREAMGAEALKRQEREKRIRCTYCGGYGNQHMNLCPKRKRS
jgi:hypothetical protein